MQSIDSWLVLPYNKCMKVNAIEQPPEVQQAARVLSRLEHFGIKEPGIAAGWTRSLLTSEPTNDIDVPYVGTVHYEEAQNILATALDEINPDNRSM